MKLRFCGKYYTVEELIKTYPQYEPHEEKFMVMGIGDWFFLLSPAGNSRRYKLVRVA